ncbi:MAG TPA: sulfotransferase [Sphingomicrobium sp.]|nr:sulfotransferase [Sphingomicrobium sp.]
MSPQFKAAVEAFQSGDLERARTLAESELSGASSPQAHHLLGLVHCRLGDPASGIEHLRAAAEAEPENPSYRIMLMRALVDAGRGREVLDFPEPPPIRSAAALELWKARGEAADAAEDVDARIRSWSEVTAAAPDDWRAWANLGSALTAQLAWEQAIEAVHKAVQLNPTDSSLRWSLSSTLAAADRQEDALLVLDEFERLAGRTSNSALARGRCLLALLRLGEVEKEYRDALRLAPDNTDAYRQLGLFLERTNRLDLLDQLIDEASAAGVPKEELARLHVVRTLREGRAEEAYTLLESVDPAEDPIGWHLLKAKIADRLGKSAEAFAAAEAMNRIAPSFDSWRKRGADYRARLRNLAKTLIEAGSLPQLPEADRRSPAFLVGFPRSGTTLLDTFLMGHRDTAVLEEVHLLGTAEREIGRAAELPNASLTSLKRAREAYYTALDQHVDRDFSGLVVDKLPLNLLGGPFIQSLFPGAPIIFAQRHPCDAVLSAFMQSFVMNDAMASFLTIEDAADLYDAVMSGWTAMREAFPLNTHTVRYERLVEDPESELRPLIDFLGLPWDKQVLAHTQTAKKRGAILTPSYNQVTEPLTSRSAGRWKRYRKQLEPVLPVLLPWAERLGYGD